MFWYRKEVEVGEGYHAGSMRSEREVGEKWDCCVKV